MNRLTILRAVAVTLPAALLLGVGAPAAAQSLRQCTRTGNRVECDVDWSAKASDAQKISLRLTPKTALALRTINFNYVFFDATWSVQAREVPGYRYLEGQWTDFLNLGAKSGVGGSASVPAFLEEMQLWRTEIDRAAEALGAALDKVPHRPGLAPAEATSIAALGTPFAATIARLTAQREAVRQLILVQYGAATASAASTTERKPITTDARLPSNTERPQTVGSIRRGDSEQQRQQSARGGADSAGARAAGNTGTATATITTSPIAEAYYAQQLFDAESKRHDAVVDKIETFVRLATDVGRGRTKDFEPQKSGTIVTATTRAVARNDGADAQVASAAGATTVSYYVQSELPVAFHFGPAYTNLARVEIEKVQRPNQGDLFQQTDTPSGGSDLIAFLTYMFTPLDIPQYDAGFGATLGTGVRSIGERIYIGGTAKFSSRLFVTVGRFSESFKEGDTANAAGSNLFTTVRNVRKWGWFYGMSVSPF